MVVVFFKNNFEYVREFISQHDNCIAFWYAEGLLSYKRLDEILTINKLVVEIGILNSIRTDYPHFFVNTSYETFEESRNTRSQESQINFLASNDTITYLFKNIIDNLKTEEYSFYFKNGENAKEASLKLGINPKGPIEVCLKDSNKSGLLVLGNDWGLEERRANNYFIRQGINTACVQESSIDLNPIDKRMRYCSFPIFQGLNSLQNIELNKMICGVIGNPRFENLRTSPLPEAKRVFINVNFTYGMFEEEREKWVNDVYGICSELGVDYILSQHPRDGGNFAHMKLLKSNAGLVHQTIIESSVVVSRFSALLLEALCLGRPAIYYNPHGEKMFYRFDSDDHNLFYASNAEELKKLLERVTAKEYKFIPTSVLNYHLGNTSEGKASQYIAQLLSCIKSAPPLKMISRTEVIVVEFKIFQKKVIGKIKKLLKR